MPSEAEIAALRAQLEADSAFYARSVIRIVNKARSLVALNPRPAQLKLEAALVLQAAAGRPQRALVLKSRKTGISTWMQMKALQRTSFTPFEKAMTVAHDGKTAAELLEIAEIMHSHLPSDPVLAIKPRIRNRERGKTLVFGEPSADARARGILGLNSSLTVDTAREVEAGRGFTFGFLHLSEVAFWNEAALKKLTALLNAVPDEPNTLIVQESTANGDNHFKADWLRAEDGTSEYAAVFIGWPEDPDCVRPFASLEDRAEFIEEVGQGPWGEDEHDLLEEGCSYEQLYWRRWAIENRCRGSLETFHQEYPSNAEEAFLGTGKTLFDKKIIAGVKRLTAVTDPVISSPDNPGPASGVLTVGEVTTRKGRLGALEVPTTAVWVPRAAAGFGDRHPWWRVWEEPDPGVKPDAGEPGRRRGEYVISCDPMSGEETEGGDLAWHGVQVLNHRTLGQAAEYRSRIDPDLLARELLLAAIHWNQALIVVEITGGYGLSIVRKLYHDFGYKRMFFRRRVEGRKEEQVDRLGWSTDRATKPLIEDGAKELLREGTHGIRSRVLAGELGTYVKNKAGKTGPDTNKFSDLLLPWMFGQHVARDQRPPPDKVKKQASSSTRAIISRKAGY